MVLKWGIDPNKKDRAKPITSTHLGEKKPTLGKKGGRRLEQAGAFPFYTPKSNAVFLTRMVINPFLANTTFAQICE